MSLTEIIAPIYAALRLSAIPDPWIRALAVFAGASIYFIFLSGICLAALPKRKPVRPIAAWKALPFFFVLVFPLLFVGLALPFLLLSLHTRDERSITDTFLYQSWISVLFVGSFLPGFMLLWRRFRSYETPNSTVHLDARKNIARGSP